MKYTFVLYILFCVFIGLMVTSRLYQMDKTVASFVYLILAILVFVFFGLRWFKNINGSSVQWPPIMNMCPDYLTAYKRKLTNPDGSTSVRTDCIDIVGVSRNCGVTRWPNNGDVPTEDKYYFSLEGDMDAKCKRARDKGLSWEACDFGPAAGGGGGGASGSGECKK